jgi:hypothetical protein
MVQRLEAGYTCAVDTDARAEGCLAKGRSPYTDIEKLYLRSEEQGRYMSTSEATKVITASAKSVLRPFGCIQKGRSRVWIDDRSWWVGVVEFQPSGWSMGSYLNVSACWLWDEKDHLSFDVPSRQREFHPFLEEHQFSRSATLLAEDAKSELIVLRERFRSPLDVSKLLSARADRSIWDHYHLGVSAGLAGEMVLAGQSFEHVMFCPGAISHGVMS